MGPCTTCGQLTEPEADFCPACAGYAAPATIYSYAPSRLSRPEGDLEQILLPLQSPSPSAPAPEGASWTPLEPEENRQPPGAIVAKRTRLPARDRVARVRASAAQRREGRWLVAAATLIVLIIAAGTVLLQLARPAPARAPQARPAASTGRPAPTPSATPSPGPQIAVAPAAASSPDEAVVQSFLASYFTAINKHDFAAYQQLFSAQLRADLPEAGFIAGYGTTTDSAIRLTSIGLIGAGELVAQVSFVSHQLPASSPTNSACTAWTVSLYLLQQDSSYLLQQPPAGYQASFTAC